MTFTSALFVLFLPVVFLVFCSVTDRARWLVLLIASYGFYSSFKSPFLSWLGIGFVDRLRGRFVSSRLKGPDARRHPGMLHQRVPRVLFFAKYLPISR
jgi:hypothetical protein